MVVFSAIAAAVGAVGLALGSAAGAVGAGVAAAGAATGLGTAGLISAGVGIAGLGITAYGQYAAYQASKDMTKAQKVAEGLRKQQTQLELNNTAIQSVRAAQLTRAQNLVRGTAQTGTGAAFGSALANSTSSVESALGYQLDTQGQAGQIGFGIFAANAQYSDASTNRSIASGISSLGQATLGSLPSIERVGTYAAGKIGGSDLGLYNWAAGTQTTAYNGSLK